MKRNWLLYSNDYRNINHNSFFTRIFTILLFLGFMLMTWSFIYLSLDSKGKNLNLAPNTGNYVYGVGRVVQVVFFIVLILELMVCFRRLFPFKNLANFMNNGFNIMILWILSTIISILPLALGISLGNSGIIATIVAAIIVVDFEIYHFRSWLMDSLQKMYGTKEKLNIFDKFNKKLLPIDEFKTFVRLIGIFFIIAICGIFETNGQVGPSWKERLLIGLIVPLLYVILIEILRLSFSAKLSWYYIKKYPTEYRLYYKISDKLWYLGEKRAAKHPSVYRPEDEKKINSNEI